MDYDFDQLVEAFAYLDDLRHYDYKPSDGYTLEW
jgi:hypothetical protein